MYLNVAAALANVDPSLEEAARNMGDHGLRLFRKITFPLMLPGYFAGAVLVFIWAFTDLGTPLIFDYQRVVAFKIFDAVNDLNTNPMAYALVVIVIVLALAAFAAARFCFGGRGHEMLSKGTVAAREVPASRTASVLIYGGILLLAAVALLPHFGVFLTSITAKWSGTVFPTQITGDYYVRALHNELARTGVRNSLFLSFGSTLMDVLLGVGIALILVRRRFQGSGLLDALAMMPLAVPGIVLAFGYVAGFSGTPLDPRRNPLPLLMIAYSVRRLPYMTRAAYAGFQQTSVTLEEAAMNVGASPDADALQDHAAADPGKPHRRRDPHLHVRHARSLRKHHARVPAAALPADQGDLPAPDGAHGRGFHRERDGRHGDGPPGGDAADRRRAAG